MMDMMNTNGSRRKRIAGRNRATLRKVRRWSRLPDEREEDAHKPDDDRIYIKEPPPVKYKLNDPLWYRPGPTYQFNNVLTYVPMIGPIHKPRFDAMVHKNITHIRGREDHMSSTLPPPTV